MMQSLPSGVYLGRDKIIYTFFWYFEQFSFHQGLHAGIADMVKLVSIKQSRPFMSFWKSQCHRSVVAGKVFQGSEQSAHICLILVLSQVLSAVLLKTDFGTDRPLIWYGNSNLLEVWHSSNFYRLQAVFSTSLQSKIFSTEVILLDQNKQMSTHLYCCDISTLFEVTGAFS